MPIPEPPQRQCARYSAAGRRCDRLTPRYDQWCGDCDGFAQAIEPSMEERKKRIEESWVRREKSAHRTGGAGSELAEKVPLEPEDLADMRVSRGAIQEFLKRHGGSQDAARQQILSLLEDCMTSGKTRKKQSGYWDLTVRGGTYGVTLDPDLTLVTSYRTVHLERTWAQVKAGVKSRVSGGSR